MEDLRLPLTASITNAQSELEEALSYLANMPAVDGKTVAFAAHTLNNYLTVTGAAIQLILNKLGEDVDPQIKVWLDSTMHATDLMSGTVSKLMSASTDETTELRKDEVDLTVLVERVCKFYQRLADSKAIKINYIAEKNIPKIATDRVAVAAVLDNILSNAIKYSERNKEISVFLNNIIGFIECSVSDEGPGLSTEDQKKLFQKGVTLTPRPTYGERSSGYGLAVAKDLITKLGGEITCRSKLGKGTTFSIRLPKQ